MLTLQIDALLLVDLDVGIPDHPERVHREDIDPGKERRQVE